MTQSSKPKSTFSNLGFILVLLGAVIGLGNIWRFPRLLAKHGGGNFLICFLVVSVLITLPVIYWELSYGRRLKLDNAQLFESLAKSPGKAFGFTIGFIQFACFIYYLTMTGWAVMFFGNAFYEIVNPQSTDVQLLEAIKGDASATVGNILTSSFVWKTAVAFIIVFLIAFGVVASNNKSSIEKISKFIMPMFFVLTIILLCCTVNLKGSFRGINELMNWDKTIWQTEVWKDAIQQSVYSVGVGTGVYIVFSKKINAGKSNLNKAVLLISSDCLVSIIAGIIIYSVLGEASIKKTEIFKNIKNRDSSFFLAYEYLPQAFKDLTNSPAFNNVLKGGFFLLLSIAGITTAIVLLEVAHDSIINNTKINKWLSIGILSAITISCGLISTLQNGRALVDVVDLTTATFAVFIVLTQNLIFLINNVKFLNLKYQKTLIFKRYTQTKRESLKTITMIISTIGLIAFVVFGLIDLKNDVAVFSWSIVLIGILHIVIPLGVAFYLTYYKKILNYIKWNKRH